MLGDKATHVPLTGDPDSITEAEVADAVTAIRAYLR